MARTGTEIRRDTRFALSDLQKTETTFDKAKNISSLKVTFPTGSIHLDLKGDETKYLNGIGDWLSRNAEMGNLK